MDKKVS